MCDCTQKEHATRLVVITGGPGAGKTALLEMVRRNFCEHVTVLPEAASIVFGGGFPRHPTAAGRRAAQRAIYYVQRELERGTIDERRPALVLCDRGTVDGRAYWPDADDGFLPSVGSSEAAELARYTAVIHLCTPDPGAYNHANPLRVETVREAAALDEKIRWAWSNHPHVHVVPSTHKFIEKVMRALELIRDDVPACCRANLEKR